MRMNGNALVGFVLAFIFSIGSFALAAVTVGVTQSGADSGTVMSGKTFTVTASGWSGDCNSAYLDLSECGVCDVSESQTKSISGTSVSWTTVTASKASDQKITVSVSGTCTPDFGDETLDVITPPSLSAAVSPSSTTADQGDTFSISIDIQNTGETTARFGSISVSPSDFSIDSGCSPSSIAGGQSLGVSCTIGVSSQATTGSSTATFTVNPSNADSTTETMDIEVSGVETTTTPGGGGGGGAGGGTTSTSLKVVAKVWTALVPGSPAKWVINSTGLSTTEVELDVKQEAKTVRLTIGNLLARPAEISKDLSGKVYQYLNFTLQNMADSNLNTARIRVMVPKSWLQSNSLDPNSVSLYRYRGAWEKISTSKVSEDASYIYYDAYTTGFSYFAIAAEAAQAAETTMPATTTPPTVVTTQPAFKQGQAQGMLPILAFLTLILLIVLGYVYYKKLRHW